MWRAKILVKLHESCTKECITCGACNCDIDDHSDNFTRASKEELEARYYSLDYPPEDKEKIRVWLKVQFDYEVK